MFEEFFVALALGGAIVAAVIDIKYRIIPNKLTFSLIATGFVGHLAYGLLERNVGLFLEMLKSFISIFVVGYLLWMLGAWSAGDAKEFLFVAALIPAYPAFLYGAFGPTLAYYPFVITVLFNTLLSIFPLIFIYSLYVSIKKRILFRFIEPLKNMGKYVEASFVLVAVLGVSTSLGTLLAAPVALFLLYKVQKNYRLALSALGILVAYVSYSEPLYPQGLSLFSSLISTLVVVVAAGLLLNSLNIVRKEALTEEAKISELDEGSIIAEEIYIQDKKVVIDRRGMMEKIKDAAITGDLSVLRRKSIVNMGAAGVSQEEIEVLRGHLENGGLEDRIKVKKSAPFAPAILMGLLISFVIGDAMLVLKMWLYG